ncbi:MAG: hypothetical protein K6C36_09350 [Clostridia bacterium]|nr:hypothetical protein [Clostridia bacterium]
MKKRIICAAVAACMLLTFVPFSLAAGFDVDGDGQTTAQDARLALRAALALESLDPSQAELADADGDGEVTAQDARAILRAALGMDGSSEDVPKDAGSMLAKWMEDNAEFDPEYEGAGEYCFYYAPTDWDMLEIYYYPPTSDHHDDSYFDLTYVSGREITLSLYLDGDLKNPQAAIFNDEDGYGVVCAVDAGQIRPDSTSGLTILDSQDLSAADEADAKRITGSYILWAVSCFQSFCNEKGLDIDVRSDLGFINAA